MAGADYLSNRLLVVDNVYKEFTCIVYVCLTIVTLMLTIRIKVTIVRQTIQLNSLYKKKLFRKICMLIEFSSSAEKTSYQGYGLLLLLNMAVVRNMQTGDRELKQQMRWSL